MSRKEDMQYLIKPQTLRNKDYVTISRNEYEQMLEAFNAKETLLEGVKKLSHKEIELNKREKDLMKYEQKIRYDCHKKILDFAKQFINGV